MENIHGCSLGKFLPFFFFFQSSNSQMIDSKTRSSLWWAHGIQRKHVVLGWCVLSGTSQFSRKFPLFFSLWNPLTKLPLPGIIMARTKDPCIICSLEAHCRSITFCLLLSSDPISRESLYVA